MDLRVAHSEGEESSKWVNAGVSLGARERGAGQDDLWWEVELRAPDLKCQCKDRTQES